MLNQIHLSLLNEKVSTFKIKLMNSFRLEKKSKNEVHLTGLAAPPLYTQHSLVAENQTQMFNGIALLLLLAKTSMTSAPHWTIVTLMDKKTKGTWIGDQKCLFQR